MIKKTKSVWLQLLLAVITMLATFGLLNLGLRGIVHFVGQLSETYSLIAEIIFAVLVFIAAVIFRQVRTIFHWDKREFTEGFAAGLFVFIMTCMLILSMVLLTIQGSAAALDFKFPNTLVLILELIWVGIAEELLFRGVIQNLMYDAFGTDTKKGIWLSITVTSILFGLLHMSNLAAGVTLKAAIIQAIAAVGLGMYFGAVYYRGNNIYVVMLLHGMMDISAIFSRGGAGLGDEISAINNVTWVNIFPLFLYVGITVFLLRNSKLRLPGNQNKQNYQGYNPYANGPQSGQNPYS